MKKLMDTIARYNSGITRERNDMTEIREELHARHDYCWTNEAYQEQVKKRQKLEARLKPIEEVYKKWNDGYYEGAFRDFHTDALQAIKESMKEAT